MAFLTYPDIERVPGLFAYDALELKWGDIWWAYTNGVLGWYELAEIAKQRIKCDMDVDMFADTLDLAEVTKSNIWQASSAIEKLALAEPSDECVAKQKFLCITLAWLYRNWTALANPFEAIDAVYADFGYPEEIENLASYMPSTDAYDTCLRTQEEIIMRLHTKLFNFLNKMGVNSTSPIQNS